MLTRTTPRPTESASSDLSMAVGFIGTGRMGFPLAQNLLRSHVPLVVHNRTRSKMEPLLALGARWTATAKDVARGVSRGVVFLVLTDAKAVQKVLFGRGGLAHGAASGLLVVDCSTIDPEESRTFATRLHEQGIGYMDAPIGGGVEMAEHGAVTFFVGGDAADLARVRPLLDRMGQKVVHVGPVGSGAAMKLVNNLLTIGVTALSTEALSLADAFHLDPGRTLDVLKTGGARSTMLERKASAFEARQYPAQFTTTLARKDLRLIEKAGNREHHPLRMIHEARRLLDEAIAQGHSEEDFSSVLEATLARGRPSSPKAASPADASDEQPPPASGGGPAYR